MHREHFCVYWLGSAASTSPANDLPIPAEDLCETSLLADAEDRLSFERQDKSGEVVLIRGCLDRIRIVYNWSYDDRVALNWR